MATPFPATVSAVQVGSYFVGQYYQVLQQSPDFVHQFYTDASTMLRIDGNVSDTATGMLQIHELIMSLNFMGIEIKTAHSLDSWNGGVVVMVSGSAQTKDSDGRRKFAQTFFLAPQEKGYFVLNDIFHFLDEEQILQHPAAILTHGNFEAKLNTASPIPEPVPEYMVGGEIHAREFVTSPHVEDNDTVDKYSIPELQQQLSESDNVVEETPAEESIASSYTVSLDTVRDPPPVPVEEPVGEPPKQTYASILRIAKGQSGPSVAQQASLNKSAAPVAMERPPLVIQPAPQQSHHASSMGHERSGSEGAEEITTPEEEGEVRSVYVRNLPSTVSASDIEQEFKNFGRIKPEGVVVRNRKDIGVCYAFVEFEDALGVQIAVKASPIQLAGRQVHIEERRANGSSSRGGRRGRGRGSYQSEAPRGRFSGWTSGRGNGQDGGDRDYSSRPRGNGFHQRVPRQERGILGNHVSRNGPYASEA